MLKVTMTLALVSGAAWAQDPWSAPNPFDAHDSGQTTPGESPPLAAAPYQGSPSAGGQGLLRKGTKLLGGSGRFSYTSASNDQPGGGSVDNSTLFMRITPAFGYMVTDRVEIAIAPGLLLRQIDRGSEGTTNEEALLVEVTGRYFKPISPAFSLFAGGGLGGSFGTSERSLVIQDSEGRDRAVTEQTSTTGFTMSLGGGAAYVIENNLQLRAGLEMDWLLGTETIDSIDEDLDLSTLSIGLGIGIHYLF